MALVQWCSGIVLFLTTQRIRQEGFEEIELICQEI